MDELSPTDVNPFEPPEVPPSQETTVSAPPLHYEETPIIETPPPPPVAAPSSDFAPEPVAQEEVKPPKSSFPFAAIVVIVILIVLVVWLYPSLRQLLPGGLSQLPSIKTQVTPTPIVTVAPDPYATWKTYSVISGSTRKAVDGISFKLPPEVTELFCDGTNCSSQGTYLPGGTRFTVAVRGAGQILADYRGKIITDFGGKPFVSTPTTVGGRVGATFIGDFTGTTVTGYTFTKMRGVMISVTDTISLEVNHFSPIGVVSDFAADDVLFDKILNSFVFTGLPVPTLNVTPQATSSGS